MSLIEAVAKFIEENYLFPDMAQKLAQHLREADYSSFDDIALCEAVTTDLIRISNDQHMLLRYEPPQNVEQDPEKDRAEQARFLNYGFQKFERLSGNIGYCKLTELPPVSVAGKMFEAIITLLLNTDAIIKEWQEALTNLSL